MKFTLSLFLSCTYACTHVSMPTYADHTLAAATAAAATTITTLPPSLPVFEAVNAGTTASASVLVRVYCTVCVRA